MSMKQENNIAFIIMLSVIMVASICAGVGFQFGIAYGFYSFAAFISVLVVLAIKKFRKDFGDVA